MNRLEVEARGCLGLMKTCGFDVPLIFLHLLVHGILLIRLRKPGCRLDIMSFEAKRHRREHKNTKPCSDQEFQSYLYLVVMLDTRSAMTIIDLDFPFILLSPFMCSQVGAGGGPREIVIIFIYFENCLVFTSSCPTTEQYQTLITLFKDQHVPPPFSISSSLFTPHCSLWQHVWCRQQGRQHRLIDSFVTTARMSLANKNNLRVLVLGSGGREHALCWKLKQSPQLGALYCLPGNAGIAAVAECVGGIGVSDVPAVVRWAKEHAIDFVVVGPEDPLTAGVVDELGNAGITAFGPSKAAAELEGSKAFMKDILHKYNVPTATYIRTKSAEEAKAYITKTGAPIVVKASGLCAGKGVLICETVEDGHKAVDEMMTDKVFGASGDEVVVEEFLDGEEASYFALCDGETAIAVAGAQDHKRVGDGDTGLNTGGMGAYSPAPVLTPEMEEKIMNEIMIPTVKGMKAEGKPFKGVLFAGVMIKNGQPKTLEHNVRFGDPECQTVMMRLKSDLLNTLIMAAEGRFSEMKPLEWDPRTALLVVMATQGYPGSYPKKTPINNLTAAADVSANLEIFHAGTGMEGEQLVSTGGRVLGVTAIADDVLQAQTLAYQGVDKVEWAQGFCRRDIGYRAVERLKAQ
jgi:phosphoribosylamine--glycine ligase